MEKKKFIDVLDEVVADSEAGVYSSETRDGSVVLLTKRSEQAGVRVAGVCTKKDATLMLFGLGETKEFKEVLAVAAAMLFLADQEFLAQVSALLDEDGKLVKKIVGKFAEEEKEEEETQAERRITFTLPLKEIIS